MGLIIASQALRGYYLSRSALQPFPAVVWLNVEKAHEAGNWCLTCLVKVCICFLLLLVSSQKIESHRESPLTCSIYFHQPQVALCAFANNLCSIHINKPKRKCLYYTNTVGFFFSYRLLKQIITNLRLYNWNCFLHLSHPNYAVIDDSLPSIVLGYWSSSVLARIRLNAWFVYIQINHLNKSCGWSGQRQHVWTDFIKLWISFLCRHTV